MKRILKLLGITALCSAVFVACFFAALYFVPTRQEQCMKLTQEHFENVAIAAQCMSFEGLCVVTYDELERLMRHEQRMHEVCGTTPAGVPQQAPQIEPEPDFEGTPL